MDIEYSEEVARCNFTIKCIPKNTMRQKVERFDIILFPATSYCTGKDGLNNTQIYGVNEHPHKLFSFKIDGVVMAGCTYYEEVEDDSQTMIFKHPYGLNKAGNNITDFYKKIKPMESLSDYEKAMEIMKILYENMEYKPGTTFIETTAEEAFSQRCGVCQDYAHIFISLLHLAHIPARYVTGLIVGEGASHAWVEILWNGKWYGLDPTNNKMVTDEHIKIGVGRDARDCTINRGIMHGGGPHTQTINVCVNEIDRKEN